MRRLVEYLGRTRSEQKKNMGALVFSDIPRGPAARKGREMFDRAQLGAELLWELGYDRLLRTEARNGGSLVYRPMEKDRWYDFIWPARKYTPVPIDRDEIRRMVRLALRKK